MLNQIEQDIEDRQNNKEAVSGNIIGRRNIPDVAFDFHINRINLTLVDNF